MKYGSLRTAWDELVALAARLLSDNALFMLINSYTAGLSASTMGYLLNLHVRASHGGKVSA